MTTVPTAAAPTTTIAPATMTRCPPVATPTALVAANRTVLEQGLAQTDVPSNLRPSLRDVGADRAAVYRDDCVAVGRVIAAQRRADTATTDAAFTIILYGDSHAAQWFPALEAMADERHFELIVMIKGGCPTAAVSIPTATLARTCPIWRDQAVAFIAAEQPELLLVSASAGYPERRRRVGAKGSTRRCDESCR